MAPCLHGAPTAGLLCSCGFVSSGCACGRAPLSLELLVEWSRLGRAPHGAGLHVIGNADQRRNGDDPTQISPWKRRLLAPKSITRPFLQMQDPWGCWAEPRCAEGSPGPFLKSTTFGAVEDSL